MTAPSAYPRTVDELIPHARDLADRLGKIPSRNLLMTTFKVGGPKAKELLAALMPAPAASTAPEPIEPEPPAEPILPAEPVAEPAVPPAPLPPISADKTPDLGIARPSAAPVEPPVAELGGKPERKRRPVVWPVLILCLPAFVAVWGGWVEMGRMTGFGMVKPLPGIADNFEINTAITLPIGVETYAAYALYVWLSGLVDGAARKFAMWSAIGSLLVGGGGQLTYHLMVTAGWQTAPWPITAAVACLPVAVLGMGAGLAHLMHRTAA
ncbi:ABC transporter permease [Actinoplanes ianthinogenes]|uniref:ABC transporter permease n=1 Tax=Actinoplanes ianthinogenes TaxID=122358 RepID=A0ABM7LZD5_9ACTN|nr:ABC transporter permease [Actinoplanes ianthinogenes]BCJ44713.1 ABC transporter permease [Actinoplanes ianthinogenes]GGQ99541.1 ABC transporter permease [Actinoplanes ianthinogenes]